MVKSNKIFISYAHEDSECAKRLFDDLSKAGQEPWLDSKSLLPGQKWEIEIRKAIKESRYFIALLSSHSVNKIGYINKELTQAIDVLDEFPESEIFLIPARIDKCIPSHERFTQIHWVDLFPDWDVGVNKIISSITTKTSSIKKKKNRPQSKNTNTSQKNTKYRIYLVILLFLVILVLTLVKYPYIIHKNDVASVVKYRGDINNSGYVNQDGISKVKSIKWKFKTNSLINSSPLFYNNRIYVGGYDGYVYALNHNSGIIEWKFVTGDFIGATAAIYDNNIFIGSADGYMYSLNAENGKMNWNFKTHRPITSSASIYNGIAYFGGWDGFFYALDATSGDQIWKFKTANGNISYSPAISDGVIYFGDWDGYLYALDAITGKEKWRFSIDNKIDYSPAVSNDNVYIGDWDGNFYAINKSNGTEKWKFKTIGMGTDPAFHNGLVYIGSGGNILNSNKYGYLYAINEHTGQEVWKYKTDAMIYSAPLVTNNIVYFGCMDKHLYALLRSNGELLWKIKLDDVVQRSSPTIKDECIYIADMSGNLYAIEGITGNILSKNHKDLKNYNYLVQESKEKFYSIMREAKDNRKIKTNIITGDLNYDDIDDVVIDYCVIPNDEDYYVEGGGNALAGMRCWDEGFVIFANNGVKLELLFKGEKPTSSEEMYMDAIVVSNNILICKVKTFGKTDGRWPSIDKEIQFKVQNGHLLRM